MSKLHLNLNRVEPDVRRAEMMGTRFIEGLMTIDAAGRRTVFQAIGAAFCMGCGSNNPTCRCQEGK